MLSAKEAISSVIELTSRLERLASIRRPRVRSCFDTRWLAILGCAPPSEVLRRSAFHEVGLWEPGSTPCDAQTVCLHLRRGFPIKRPSLVRGLRSLVTFQYLHAQFDVSAGTPTARGIFENTHSMAWGFGGSPRPRNGHSQKQIHQRIHGPHGPLRASIPDGAQTW